MAAIIPLFAALLSERSGVAGRMGKSYGDHRELYTALGYPLHLTFSDFMAKYRRHEIAQAVVNIPVDRSWLRPPTIVEPGEEDSPLETGWKDLKRRLPVEHYMQRVDKLSMIGSNAILVCGFADGKTLDQALGTAKGGLRYMMPYSEAAAKISAYDEDTESERFGLPLMYDVNPGADRSGSARGVSKGAARKPFKVHASRVIHVASNCLENDVLGVSALEPIFNRLIALEMLVGGSAEMFWRGAFQGLAALIDKDVKPDDVKKMLEATKTKMKDFVHGLTRTLQLQGATLQNVAPSVADPANHVAAQIDMICACTRIPKRILLGSERGELASSADERSFDEEMDVRRVNRNERMILRPFIDLNIRAGVLPKAKDSVRGYTVTWPPLQVQGVKDLAEAASGAATAMRNFVDGRCDQFEPSQFFMAKHLGYTQDEIETIDEMMGDINRMMDEGDETFVPTEDDLPARGKQDGSGAGEDDEPSDAAESKARRPSVNVKRAKTKRRKVHA